MSYTHASKKFTHVLIFLISRQALLKLDIAGLPKIQGVQKYLFGVRRVNETKVTGVYLRCGRNKAFYHDFFVETDFISGYTDGY